MRTDSRGRLRFTHNGTRFEINNKGVLRSYARDRQFDGSERAQEVNVSLLDINGMAKLYRSVGQHRKNARERYLVN